MTVSKIKVPFEGNPNSKIWVIGEAPGAEEEMARRPFVGPSGALLFETLARYGVERKDVYIANLCAYRPSGNDFKHTAGTPQLIETIKELDSLLKQHKPNVVALLGAATLTAFTGKSGINRWRGSIIEMIRYKHKSVACFHPAYILRSPADISVFDLDIKRIVEESKYPELNLPEYNFEFDPVNWQEWLNEKILAVDIETRKDSFEIICVGFARNEKEAIVFDFKKNKHAVEALCQSPAIKIFHNGIFDSTVLEENGIVVNNYSEDTILQAHVLYAELPRKLAFLTSIYTRQPYYKSTDDDSKGWSEKRTKAELFEYNATDCVVTFKCWLEQSREINEDEFFRDTYRYSISCVPLAREISRAGLLIDNERVNAIRDYYTKRQLKLTAIVNAVAGYDVNVQSPKQLQKLLYEHFGFETKKNKGKVTANENAVVSLIAHAKDKVESLKREENINEWKLKLVALQSILKLKEINKLLSSYINVQVSGDSRLRGLFRVDGTETGRWSCSKYIDGTGINMQTPPRSILEIE